MQRKTGKILAITVTAAITSMVLAGLPYYNRLAADDTKKPLSSLRQTSNRRAQFLDELIDRYDASRCKECHEEIYAQWE